MMTNTKYSNLFITGCDKNTRWMLPWFEENFYKHNPDANLYVFDFDKLGSKSWFNKPVVMRQATEMAEKICWLDTDCEVRADISSIFDLTEFNKLAMVEDQPWSMRRGERWHNSGVVAFANRPLVLDHWAEESIMMVEDRGPMFGDQDILHGIVREGLKREIHIRTIPKQWNTLRLDLIDRTAPSNIKIMHWTGRLGKEEIRKQMNE